MIRHRKRQDYATVMMPAEGAGHPSTCVAGEHERSFVDQRLERDEKGSGSLRQELVKSIKGIGADLDEE